jgi:hypothetical protein
MDNEKQTQLIVQTAENILDEFILAFEELGK